MISGCLGGIAGNPADVVLVRMATDSTLPEAKRRRYRNALDGIQRIIREEGVMALSRGLVPSTVRYIGTRSPIIHSDVFPLDARCTTDRTGNHHMW